MTISTTLWFVYRGMMYCGLSGLLLTLIPHMRLHKRALQLYWLLNLLIMGSWYASQFSTTNWLVVSTLPRWIIALWLNANMAYAALGVGFLVLSMLLRLLRRRSHHLFWRQPNPLLISTACMLSAFGVYEAMSPPLLRQYDVYLDQLPPALNGMKIAQITDSHIGDFVSSDDLKTAVKRLNAEKPDLLVMTGDLLDDERQLPSAFSALAQSNAPLGVIAILGNHEKYHGLDVILKKYQSAELQQHIRLLVDESLPLRYHETEFQIVGVDYPLPANSRRKMAETAELDYMQRSAAKAFRAVNQQEWILCLTHHPDFFDLAAANHASLSLAGHTHGGQVLPLGYTVGKLWFHYLKGWYQRAPSQLYVSTGMGHVWPYRLGVPTEITTFTLHPRIDTK
ncbi:metallophosphoesterase [Tolumonas lignilytica]|uniref:metallophosphoesterase n=1 Tax=Tolumonas lignilytica TaxID=1283284 RepID=UPI000465708E|nr:metallophosphoesterase [Tolumonas lignilytica]